MSSPEFSIRDLASETPVLRGPGVSLAFTRANGLVHSLELLCKPGSDGGERARYGEPFVSVSPKPGCDIEPADPSRVFNPVYQELVEHEVPKDRGPGLCLLLTGSCFEHHFSAVFSLYRDPVMPSSIVFEVDLADRCRAPIKTLAATYSVDHVGQAFQPDVRLQSLTYGAIPPAVSLGPSSVAWRGGTLGDGVLELLAEPPARVIAAESNQSSTSVQVEAWIDPQTFTQRLHYFWRWTSCADLTR
jgi:hypothetical protein